MMIALLNYLLGALHMNYAANALVRVLPPMIPTPVISLWVWVVLIMAAALLILLRRESRQLEEMRQGKIPLGQVTKSTAEDFKQKQMHSWYRPAYTKKTEKNIHRNIYIPVEPGEYKGTWTDWVFNFIVNLVFSGKWLMRALNRKIPESVKANPIYQRYSSRFLGYLEGYYEPAGMYKSTFVLKVFLFGWLLIPIFLIVISSSVNYSLPVLIIFLPIVFFFISLDAAVKMSRDFQKKMAWESVIISPFPGRMLVNGTFWSLVTNRFIPGALAILWLVYIYVLASMGGDLPGYRYLLMMIVYLLSSYLCSLAIAAGIAWTETNKTISLILYFLWIAFGCCIHLAFLFILLYPSQFTVSWNLSSMKTFNLYFPLMILSLILLGLIPLILNLFGSFFDTWARHPFDRKSEERE